MVKTQPRATPKKYVKRVKSTKVPLSTIVFRNPSPKVSFGKQPFPKQLFNTLTYTETISMSIVAGIGKATFSANGLYAPGLSGALQPLYFDQLMAIYNHYTVLRSRIKFQLMGPVSGATALASYGIVTVYKDDDLTTASNAVEASSRPEAKWVPFAFPTAITTTVWNSYDAVKTYGGTPMSNDNLQGTSTANPTEALYYSAQVWDNSGATYPMYYYVNIEYDVVWDELKTIPAS